MLVDLKLEKGFVANHKVAIDALCLQQIPTTYPWISILALQIADNILEKNVLSIKYLLSEMINSGEMNDVSVVKEHLFVTFNSTVQSSKWTI